MKILLHICCSNCALYPVRILGEEGHDFTGFWYNPNIHPEEEYKARLESVRDISRRWDMKMLYEETYIPSDYFRAQGIEINRTLESMDPLTDLQDIETAPFPERCGACYLQRLERTANRAKQEGFEAFSTTLMISPYQDYDRIVSTGHDLAARYGILFYEHDFRPYFRDAMTLSRELDLYRQNYCGCIFSKAERIREKELKKRSRALSSQSAT